MKIPAVLAVATASVLTLSACGSNSTSSTTTSGGGTTTTTTKHSTGIHVATTSLGKVLVDSRGMTLYELSADGHNHSTCDSQCLQFWPAAAPGGATKLAAATGHTTTPTGTPIATVAGHPVYTFSLDHQPGDVKGEGVNEFGGTWHAVSPTGSPVTSASSSSTPSSGGGPYGGY